MEGVHAQILQKKGDPRYYLWADGRWYFYNSMDKPLGSGAMGTVYVGYSMDGKHKVAIKRVKDKYSDVESIRKRAKLEASLAFRHPNLVEMLGVCEYPDHKGPIFILSNYVDGLTLDKHIKVHLEGNPNREMIIAREICNVLDALSYLHSRGVVHRDIKPSNIMIEEGKMARLMDLGIAKMNNSDGHTSSGFVGTPQYAAPEQILRKEDEDSTLNSNREINATTDIYALGVTFYELLTGVNPFDSEIDSEILDNSLKKKLPKNKMISKKLMKVLWKATEKEQNKRYQTAAEFKTEIENALFERQTGGGIDIDNKLLIGVASVVTLVAVLLIFLL
ncbi:MAG: serine/threonine protein kinase [Bacteroidales bacterium]|nr:serine/threonine protein kinase [Bacteroidales bacterium]